MASTQQYRISDGPGKFDLMIALFDDEPRTVRFSFQVPHERFPGGKQLPEVLTYWAEVDVWSAQRDRKPGEDWTIEGRVKRSNYGPLEAGRGMHHGDLYRFRTSFSSRTRKGTISFEELSPTEQCM